MAEEIEIFVWTWTYDPQISNQIDAADVRQRKVYECKVRSGLMRAGCGAADLG